MTLRQFMDQFKDSDLDRELLVAVSTYKGKELLRVDKCRTMRDGKTDFFDVLPDDLMDVEANNAAKCAIIIYSK